MSCKPIVCSLKSPNALSVGDSEFHSGCSTIDVVFPNMATVDIGSITFQNNYTAFVSISCKVKKTIKGETKIVWKQALKSKRLMLNPHVEKCGQDRFVINSSELRCKLEAVTALRFVMMQPSPCWKTFGLQEIKIFPPVKPTELPFSVPRWLLPTDSLRIGGDDEVPLKDQVRNAGLPDPDDISNKLHQLWNLTESSLKAGTSTPVGRFDINGSYEINLLSYAN